MCLQPVPPTTPSSDGAAALLRVSKLSVTYGTDSHAVPALRDLNLDISDGEAVGVLGESGCGKSTLALSLLALLPADARVGGTVLFRGRDLFGLKEKELRSIRGAKIALIHQEPGLALSPVMRVGDQIAEVLRAHFNLTGAARRRAVHDVLEQVHLPETGRVYNAYPHQLSGGELHRAAIAQAVACRPDLLIADEPTRALDVSTQAEILALLRQLNQELGTAILFISHNPAALAGLAKRVIVMYAGRIVEDGSLSQVFRRPLHPYTKGLLQLVPQSLRTGLGHARQFLPVIPGGPPALSNLGPGCAFEARCSERMQICGKESPDELLPEAGHRVNCFVYGH
jgi:oligopeptide/dipeptide ABC transporter ATP-binding protein